MAHKKRYHQSPKARLAESRGEERHLLRGKGMDPRRYQEMRDAGMINEDHSATANLPQQVKYHDWPKARHYHDYGLDDTIRGIDRQMDEDNYEMEKHLQPGKY